MARSERIVTCLQASLAFLVVFFVSASEANVAHQSYDHHSLHVRDVLNSTNSSGAAAGDLTHNGGQQNLAVAPPLPILQIGSIYMEGQIGTALLMGNDSSNSTTASANSTSLSKRQVGTEGPNGPIQCDANTPCADKSCCNSNNKCGYGPEHCSPPAPAKCLSNCDAQAMCGKYSDGGDVKCGENLCCSFFGWCGTDELHCINADPKGKTFPCQEGFGLCKIVPPPSCDPNGGTASNGRKVAYYQAANVRSRRCNKVSPSQINTKGLTHLNFAFATIDPASFEVIPGNPEDVPIFTEFTKLKTATLETWIAVGGFDFSDPGPTHTTWSDLCSTAGNRAKFINSAMNFMAKYGFQGIDVDWEYPSTPERGGRKEDLTNFVSLIKEMHDAFHGTYKISLTLAPDYWYLRGFDPKGMEPYVDFFGFMSYDLHGFWDANTPTVGPYIRPQTDIREIQNDTLPLWFDNLIPGKINLGIAYYGRGFTVSNPGCVDLGCQFNGPSNPAHCTNFAGVMSNREVQDVIKAKGITPRLISEAAVKVAAWDDQWIGYDDAETIAMKEKFANSQCMGGTMIWSIDFDADTKGTGDTPQVNGSITYSTDGSCGPQNGNTYCAANSPIYNGTCCSSAGYCGSTTAYCGAGCQSGCDGVAVTGTGSGTALVPPDIWTKPNPGVQCEPPCVLVLPPYPLPSPTTINFPPLVTQIIIQTTIVQGGSTTTSLVTEDTIIPIPPLTTTAIDVWAISVFSSDTTVATITAVESVRPPSFVITLPGSEIISPFSTPSRYMSSTSSSGAPVFFTTSHPVTLQPQPTVSISTPPLPPITYTTGLPPRCTQNCGSHDCDFGCPCSWGCGGGCGIFGCGLGGCGPFGCDPCGIFGCGGCGLGGCGPSNCPACGGGGGQGGEGNSDPDPESSASQSPSSTTSEPCDTTTATACETMCAGDCTTTCFEVADSCSTFVSAPALVTPLVDIETPDNDGDINGDADFVFSLMDPILSGYDPLSYSGMGPGPGPSTTDNPPPSTPPPTTTAAPSPSPSPTTTVAPSPSPSPSPDPSSPDCVACTNSLGASTCTSGDWFCLVQQCQQDQRCTACGLNCDQYKETPPNPPDLNSQVCQICQTRLGASTCPADDLNCLTNDCKSSTECLSCGIDCNTVGR